MSTISRVTTWSDNQLLSAPALNGEFNNIINDYNGGITNANISGSAAIAYSKLNLTGSIVSADISSGAAIAFSKLDSTTVAGVSATQTLTNKRITKRVETISDGTTISPNWDNSDVSKQVNTQGSGTLTVNAPTYATATDMDMREIAIKASNSQTYSFNAVFKGGSLALPSSHAGGSKWDFLLFQYSSTDSNWKLVGLRQAVT